MKSRVFPVLLLFLFHSFADAYYDEFVIGSSADYFTLSKKDDGNYYVGNQKVRLGSFNDFIYLFGTEIAGACPNLKGKPDITIIAKRTKTDTMGETKSSETKRRFYLDEKLVRGDNGCAPVTGDGIYYLPMHRFWFTGESSLSLPAANRVKIEKDGETLAHTKKMGNSWEAAEDMAGLNWDFYDTFMDSLKDFPVLARLHPSIGKGKPSFTMILNGASYKGYYVAKNLWAMKFPKSPWLVASQTWSTWEDMRIDLWRDRFFEKVKVFSNRENSNEQRLASMEELGTSWSPSIKKALQKIIKDPKEPANLRSLALRYLKQRPSLDNFGAMIHALKVSDDKEFQAQLTSTLRIRNPRGPLITESTSEEDDSKAIREWDQWWKKIAQ